MGIGVGNRNANGVYQYIDLTGDEEREDRRARLELLAGTNLLVSFARLVLSCIPSYSPPPLLPRTLIHTYISLYMRNPAYRDSTAVFTLGTCLVPTMCLF